MERERDVRKFPKMSDLREASQLAAQLRVTVRQTPDWRNEPNRTQPNPTKNPRSERQTRKSALDGAAPLTKRTQCGSLATATSAGNLSASMELLSRTW